MAPRKPRAVYLAKKRTACFLALRALAIPNSLGVLGVLNLSFKILTCQVQVLPFSGERLLWSERNDIGVVSVGRGVTHHSRRRVR